GQCGRESGCPRAGANAYHPASTQRRCTGGGLHGRDGGDLQRPYPHGARYAAGSCREEGMSAADPATFADDPVARDLLASPTLMRLAYVGANGQPHVVPIWYRYADGEFVVVTGPKADKVRHISQRPRVSMTIDTDSRPYRVLLVDGMATVENVEGMAPEYPDIVRKHLGAAADG